MVNILGYSPKYIVPSTGNPFAARNKTSEQSQIIGGSPRRLIRGRPMRKSELVEDVDMLVNNLNDRAFIYKSGKVDVLKKTGIKTVKFPNQKDASLYLLKTGWQYVR
jgi:hypothetical protein